MKRKIFELSVAVYRVTDHFPREEAIKQQLRRAANDIMAGVIEYDFFPGDIARTRTIQAEIQTLRPLLGVAKLNDFVKAINIEVLDREYSFFYGYFEREGEMSHKSRENKATVQKDMPIISDMSHAANEEQCVVADTKGTVEAVSPAQDHSVPGPKKAFVEKSITFSERISVNGNGNEAEHQHEREKVPENIQKAGIDAYNERQRSIINHIKANQSVKSTDLSTIFSNRFSIKTLQRDLAFLMERRIIHREGDKRWAVYKLHV